MPYLDPNQSEEEQSLLQPVANATPAAAPSGGSGVGAAGSVKTGSNPAPSNQSGMFTDISKYLNANQQGAAALGTRVANDVTGAATTADQAITGAGQAFKSGVDSNTNAYNADLVNNAVAHPTDYLTNTDLSKQLSGTYGGPTNFSSTTQATDANKAVSAAQDEATLTGTEGGRNQLIRKTAAEPLTAGGANLDQYLIQGTQPNLDKVTGSAAAATPLAGRLTSTANDAASQASAAAATNAATRTQALQALQTGQTNLTNTLQGTLTQQQADAKAKEDALTAFLKAGQAVPAGTGSGEQYTVGPPAAPGRMTIQPVHRLEAGPTPEQMAQLTQLGIPPTLWNSLVAANAKVVAAGGQPIDFSKYYTQGNTSALGLGNVATDAQKADLNALAQLQGAVPAALSSGQAVGGQFDVNSLANAITSILNPHGSQLGPTGYNGPSTSTGSVGGGDIGNNGGSTGGGDGGGSSGSSGSSGTSGSAGGPAVGVSVSTAIGVAAAVAAAIAAPTPVSIANAVNSIANAIAANNAANAAANAANADTDSATNGSVSDGATATTGPSGTGAAAAAAASAAADAATANGASPAAAAAAGQAAADAAVGGASPAAAAAAGANAAAAADGNAADSSDSSDGATGASGSDGGGGTGSAGSGSGSGSGAGTGGGSGSDGGGGTGASGTGSGSGSSGGDGGGGGSGSGEKDGGFIQGPGTATSDSIPTHLSNGEFVIPAHIVNLFGRNFFENLIDTRRPK